MSPLDAGNHETQPLDVVVAAFAGTCFGVDAAIRVANEHRTPILGPLVHNPVVVEDLAQQGIPIYDRYENLEVLKEEGVTDVTITAHGYPKQLKEQLADLGVKIHDATCPVLLKWVYKKIQTFEGRGYQVVIIGNSKHAEIIASKSYGQDVISVYSEEEIDALEPSDAEIVAICQTTITAERFAHLTDYLKRTKYPNLEIVDTRCNPVRIQQLSVEILAEQVDTMIILGGYNSSNTTNLWRMAGKVLGDRAYHIDKPTGVTAEMLQGSRILGVGAGTSTPKSQLEEVIDAIRTVTPRPLNVATQESPERPEPVTADA